MITERLLKITLLRYNLGFPQLFTIDMFISDSVFYHNIIHRFFHTEEQIFFCEAIVIDIAEITD